MSMINSTNRFSPVQILKNIITNAGVFVVNTIISFWFTPFLLRSLGKEMFGFIPLITSVVNYFGIITLSLTSATNRFLMIELEREDIDKSNQVFNTSFVGMLILILVTIPIGALLVIYVADILQVPPDQNWSIQLLLMGSILAFIFTTLRSSFSIAAFSQNRFDLQNFISFLGRLVQVVATVSLFTLLTPSLIYASVGIFLAALIQLAGDFYLWKRLLPFLAIKFGEFKKELFKEMMGTSTWMLLNWIGFILFMNIEMIVANQYLPLALVGMYGAVLTIPTNLRTIASIINNVWGPLILSKYSRNDYTGIDRVARTSMKLIGLSIALPIGFVCGVAREFLIYWLGPEFEAMTWVVVVLSFHLSVNLVSPSLDYLQLSLNKLKVPALVTLMTGITSLFLSIYLAQRYGLMGIAGATCVVFTLRNSFFIPIYSAIIMKKRWWHYLINLFPISLITIIVALASTWIVRLFTVSNLLELLFVGGLISVIYVFLAYIFGLSKKEKEMIMGMLGKNATE